MKADVSAMLAEVMQPSLLRRWLLSQPSDRRFLAEEGDRDFLESYLLDATGQEWINGWNTIGLALPSGDHVDMPDWLRCFSHDTLFGLDDYATLEQALAILDQCVPLQEATPC